MLEKGILSGRKILNDCSSCRIAPRNHFSKIGTLKPIALLPASHCIDACLEHIKTVLSLQSQLVCMITPRRRPGRALRARQSKPPSKTEDGGKMQPTVLLSVRRLETSCMKQLSLLAKNQPSSLAGMQPLYMGGGGGGGGGGPLLHPKFYDTGTGTLDTAL